MASIKDIFNSDNVDETMENVGETVEEAKNYLQYYAPEIKRAAYLLGVFLAANWGARYGVTRAIANGRLKIKKH